jgi:hypothetical protein
VAGSVWLEVVLAGQLQGDVIFFSGCTLAV